MHTHDGRIFHNLEVRKNTKFTILDCTKKNMKEKWVQHEKEDNYNVGDLLQDYCFFEIVENLAYMHPNYPIPPMYMYEFKFNKNSTQNSQLYTFK